MPKKSGFTLIELLVVITIIAILSAIGMIIYGGVQKGARDSKRKADVNAIANVLETHYNDTNSPCNASATAPYCATVADSFFSGGRPHDPNPGGTDYSILMDAGKTTYAVCADLENSTGNSSDAGFDSGNSVTFTYVSSGDGSYYCRSNQQ